MTFKSCVAVASVGLVLVASESRAEVTRVEILSRADVSGRSNIEQITGRAYFAVDPRHERNKLIVDLDKAPRNSTGDVEFSADFSIRRPKSGNHPAIVVEVVNRGAPLALRAIGEDFLLDHGMSTVAIGWQFDLSSGPTVLAAQIPRAVDPRRPIQDVLRIAFVVDQRVTTYALREMQAYPAADPTRSDALLMVEVGNERQEVPTDKWQLSDGIVSMPGGFEPGITYEISYRASNPPVGGLGFAVVRDFAAWLKHAPDSLAPAKHVHVIGASQSGRFLRTFLYQGFNSDEANRRVFDGAFVLIAGAAGIDLNARWSLPSSGRTSATSFPFSDRAQRDPITGIVDGVLDNRRTREHQPKTIYANTGAEYWSTRSAALLHTTPDGRNDATLPNNVRVYFMAGSPHVTAPFPPQTGLAQEKLNPTNWIPIVRGLLVALDEWVRRDVQPPPSKHPRLDDGTLVRSAEISFPSIPRVSSPRNLPAGRRIANPLLAKGAGAGTPLPMLVPQVDADGNELAGIRLPEIAVPLATYTSWNFRSPAAGSPDQLIGGSGAYIPFARRREEGPGDPRAAVSERYSSRSRYEELIREATARLIGERFLLTEDTSTIIQRAVAHWEHLTN
jgi:hypothetical protein